MLSESLPSARLRTLTLFVVISVPVLVPCFWHRHIEAGDLGSHVYNAWLAQLIQQGRAPGLYIVRQWNNVLFDLMLFHFGNIFGLAAAEKIAVSLCVLTFFWGLFFLMKAASSRPPWLLTPCFAMLAYGYVFHMGFMNYYLSLGLACFGLALLWPARRNGLIAAAMLIPIIYLAHPLGLVLLVGVGTYRLLWRELHDPQKLLLPAGSLAIGLAVHWLVARYHPYLVEWREAPLWRMTGADQFHVFGERYAYITVAFGIFAILITGIALFQSRRTVGFWLNRRLVLELYLLSFCATALLPENLQTDPTKGWIGQLASRLTLATAILGLCWLASLPPRTWHLIAYSGVAAVFFTFLYQDTAFFNRMENNVDKLTQQLPFGTRTLASMFTPGKDRTIYLHIADRACIGHCFLVSNYEPSTGQFRLRALQGSPVATASVDDSEDMQSGEYDVQEEDLPLQQIYQCDWRDLTRVCIRDLAEDEKNGRLGYHPIHNPFFTQYR
jgi:hypothetical protein